MKLRLPKLSGYSQKAWPFTQEERWFHLPPLSQKGTGAIWPHIYINSLWLPESKIRMDTSQSYPLLILSMYGVQTLGPDGRKKEKEWKLIHQKAMLDRQWWLQAMYGDQKSD